VKSSLPATPTVVPEKAIAYPGSQCPRRKIGQDSLGIGDGVGAERELASSELVVGSDRPSANTLVHSSVPPLRAYPTIPKAPTRPHSSSDSLTTVSKTCSELWTSCYNAPTTSQLPAARLSGPIIEDFGRLSGHIQCLWFLKPVSRRRVHMGRPGDDGHGFRFSKSVRPHCRPRLHTTPCGYKNYCRADAFRPDTTPGPGRGMRQPFGRPQICLEAEDRIR
jgi:hypothetical protein